MDVFAPMDPAATPPTLTVTQALQCISASLAPTCQNVWIEGEVADMKASATGHLYFKLKDAQGALNCALFKATYAASGYALQLGQTIEVMGRLNIYPKSGSLQLIVTRFRPKGQGQLYEAFLALKDKLQREGLFDDRHKKPLPAFIRQVALVTSLQAAAFHDVIQTLRNRTPWISVMHVDTLVQGEQAPRSLAQALLIADRLDVDAILLVRGGGAYEDLQAFNDERLARLIFSLKHPVVTGIGHESDFTIADFVADMRASTPSTAAQSMGPDLASYHSRFTQLHTYLTHALAHHLQVRQQNLEATLQAWRSAGQRDRFALTATQAVERLTRLWVSPQATLSHYRQRLQAASDQLAHAWASTVTRLTTRLTHTPMSTPEATLSPYRARYQSHRQHFENWTQMRLDEKYFGQDFRKRWQALQDVLAFDRTYLAAKSQTLHTQAYALQRAFAQAYEIKRSSFRALTLTPTASMAQNEKRLRASEQQFCTVTQLRVIERVQSPQGLARQVAQCAQKLTLGCTQSLARATRQLQHASFTNVDLPRALKQKAALLTQMGQALEAIHPDRPLQLGYVQTFKGTTPITRAAQLRVGDAVRLQYQDGFVNATVHSIEGVDKI